MTTAENWFFQIPGFHIAGMKTSERHSQPQLNYKSQISHSVSVFSRETTQTTRASRVLPPVTKSGVRWVPPYTPFATDTLASVWAQAQMREQLLTSDYL